MNVSCFLIQITQFNFFNYGFYLFLTVKNNIAAAAEDKITMEGIKYLEKTFAEGITPAQRKIYHFQLILNDQAQNHL